MGGNALKTTYTERCSNDKFIKLSLELTNVLSTYFNNVKVVKNYSNKETHGDIDIICATDDRTININGLIEKLFKPNEIFNNGNCHSFDYELTQIDIITCGIKDFNSMVHFYNYGLGNFIGRIAQKVGLKYGQEGFWYNHYVNGQKVGKIMISKDYKKIFEFLGLDYGVWEEGFDTLEDVFDYVTTSKYFNSKMFELKQLNKINRERNAKRKSYMSFLTYINDRDYNDYEFEEKEFYLNEVHKKFPEARLNEHMKRMEYEIAKKKYISAKFGGHEIMSRYGLKGSVLGSIISGFKDWIREDMDYEKFILNTPTDYIHIVFETYYKDFVI